MFALHHRAVTALENKQPLNPLYQAYIDARVIGHIFDNGGGPFNAEGNRLGQPRHPGYAIRNLMDDQLGINPIPPCILCDFWAACKQ